MEVRVRYLKMPVSVRGFTVREDADVYDVYINPIYTYESQMETYEHELTHIRRGDFEREDDVNRLEVM